VYLALYRIRQTSFSLTTLQVSFLNRESKELSAGVMGSTDQKDCMLSSTVLVSPPAGEPFQIISAKITVKAVLTKQKNSSFIEQNVTVTNPWSKVDKDVFVHFIPAFYTTFHLLTAIDKKLMLTETSFSLCSQKMVMSGGSSRQELSLTPMNKVGDVLIVNSYCDWENVSRSKSPPMNCVRVPTILAKVLSYHPKKKRKMYLPILLLRSEGELNPGFPDCL
jgi:hypothetical protein